MRRALIALLLLAILVAIGWWLWKWQPANTAAADPWNAVPAQAVAVVEINDPAGAWARFTGTSQFWGDVEGRPAYAALDSLVARTLRSAATSGPLLLVWAAPGEAPVLVTTMAEPEKAGPRLARAWGLEAPADALRGGPLQLRPDTALPPLHLAWANGLLMLGTDAAWVKALAAGTARPQPLAPLAEKARNSLSVGADAHVLVQAATAGPLLAGSAGGIWPQAAPVQGWLAMDVRFRPGAVLMNGLLFPAEKEGPLAALAGQAVARPDLLQVLPADVAELRVAQVEDPASYVQALNGAAPDEQLFAAYGAWVKGAVGTAASTGEGPHQWAVLGTEDPAGAARAMGLRCPDGGCPVSEYRGLPITRLADPQALATLYGPTFGNLQQPLWAALGNTIVFADSPAGMRAAIDAWTDRNSMAHAPASSEFFGRFASQATYTWWASAAGGPAAQGPLGATIGKLMLQLTPRPDGACMATCCLQHAAQAKQGPGALWTAALPAPLAMPPVLVKDYLSKTLQLFVQDKDDRLSLISCTGKVLWQRTLDGPVIGGVHQVDRYRNGKLQLLFNTARKVYLIDRLGRDVEGFPVELAAPAQVPLAAFDYEGNKDYRILLPLANRRILNLGPDGRPVQGWEAEPLPAAAMGAVEHLRLKGKDYLVVPRTDGGISVLDRRGAQRYAPALRMHHVQQLLATGGAMDIADRRMVWADSAGAVLSGTFAGRVDTLSPAASGKIAVFRHGPDRNTAILRTGSSTLGAVLPHKALFHISFPDAPAASAFAVPMPNGSDAIGLVLPERQELRLYDAEGNLWPGFPLKGAVPFAVADINLDGVPELVTADAQGVVLVHVLGTAP